MDECDTAWQTGTQSRAAVGRGPGSDVIIRDYAGPDGLLPLDFVHFSLHAVHYSSS